MIYKLICIFALSFALAASVPAAASPPQKKEEKKTGLRTYPKPEPLKGFSVRKPSTKGGLAAVELNSQEELEGALILGWQAPGSERPVDFEKEKVLMISAPSSTFLAEFNVSFNQRLDKLEVLFRLVKEKMELPVYLTPLALYVVPKEYEVTFDNLDDPNRLERKKEAPKAAKPKEQPKKEDSWEEELMKYLNEEE